MAASRRRLIPLRRLRKCHHTSRAGEPQNRTVRKFSQPFVEGRTPPAAQTPPITRASRIVAAGKRKISSDICNRNIGLFHIKVTCVQVYRLIAEHTVPGTSQKQAVHRCFIVVGKFPALIGRRILRASDKEQVSFLCQGILHPHVPQDGIRLHSVVLSNPGDQVKGSLPVNQESIASDGGSLYRNTKTL